jgi:phospholipase C
MLRARFLSSFALLLSFSALRCSSSSSVAVTDAGHPVDGRSASGDATDATSADGGHADAGHADALASDSGANDAPHADATGSKDATPDAPPACVTGCPVSAIEHLVLIVQENHTFDNYFGRYCTAASGSVPSCTAGPGCCEAGPAQDPSGTMPVTLDDTTNAAFNPNHFAACEISEIDNGLMDEFAAGAACSNAKNMAYADSASVSTYWQLAANGALADRYFQPVAGASTSNDMYFARANFVFLDDAYEAKSKGASCQGGTQISYTDPTIADLLLGAGATFGVYAGGYAVAVAADPNCAAPPAACPIHSEGYPCDYDPGDIPFEYFTSLHDNPLYMKDLTQLATDLSQQKLPSFAFVKSIGYLSEHPGLDDTITGGAGFVQMVVDQVTNSAYASNTLILVTWDESGGYYDHVAPPATSTVDNQPYGPRVPLIAVGPFAQKNVVSHVTMEHSSIVKFIEWNWLKQQTGQLGTRDAVVNNIGSLLDPSATGVTVPN